MPAFQANWRRDTCIVTQVSGAAEIVDFYFGGDYFGPAALSVPHDPRVQILNRETPGK